MRFLMLYWHPEAKDKMEEFGFRHDEEVLGDPWSTMKILFDAGLNVMMYHGKKGFPILYVDTRRFSVR